MGLVTRRPESLWKWKYDNRLHWWQQTDKREEFPTWIIEGRKGAGKTRYLAREAVKDMRNDIVVCSNFTIRDRRDGYSSVKINNWLDVLRWSVWALEHNRQVKFYVDEFHLWLDSRSFKLTPAWFRGWLAQSRHYGVGICGSVQNLRRLEVVARELVDTLYVVKARVFRLVPFVGPWVPLFWLGQVDPDSLPLDAMGEQTEYKWERTRWTFARWWAGFETRELVSVEPWIPDAQLEAEVHSLLDRAAELVAPGVIEAYGDLEQSACLADCELYIADLKRETDDWIADWRAKQSTPAQA